MHDVPPGDCPTRGFGSRGVRRRDNAIAIASGVSLYFASTRRADRGTHWVQPWTSATSRSKGRSASASRALADRLGARLDATRRARRDRQPVPRRLLRRPARRRASRRSCSTLLDAPSPADARCGRAICSASSTVCDYLFDRDKIYAYLNLDDNELFIYQRLYDLLARDVPAPDLVIYLQTPTDVLRRRLRERARADPERPRCPDDDYVRELNEAYTTSSSTTPPRRCWSSRPRSSICRGATRRWTT